MMTESCSLIFRDPSSCPSVLVNYAGMPAENDGWIQSEQIFFSPLEDVEMWCNVVVKNLFCCSFVSDFWSSPSSSSCLPTVSVNLPKKRHMYNVIFGSQKKSISFKLC